MAVTSAQVPGPGTRKRVTKERTGESVIDLMIFSSELNKHFVAMEIDEDRKHVLTRCKKTKNGIKIKESDHNVLITEFNWKVKAGEVVKKVEIHNIKNKECQRNFKKYTNETNMLTNTVDEDGEINQVIKRFMKRLNGCIANNFKRIRVNKHNTKHNDSLYDKRRNLKNKEDAESKEELIKVNKAIAEYQAANFEALKEELDKIKKNVKGKIDSKQLWKLKRKLCPTIRDAPAAINDAHGNLLTSDKALKNRALEVYSNRLKGNIIKPNLKDLETDVNYLCEIRVKLAKTDKTENWTMDNLKEVLKNLPDNKSRDPEGLANELFKESVAGTDLLEATLKLMNMIKKTQQYPEVLEKCNITSIHKKKSKKRL